MPLCSRKWQQNKRYTLESGVLFAIISKWDWSRSTPKASSWLLKARLLSAIKLDQESTRKLLHGALLIIRPLTSKLSWRMNQKFSSQLAARLIIEKITWMMEVNFSFFVFGNPEKNSKQHLASSYHKFLTGPLIGKRSHRNLFLNVCAQY
jgi:hypothetical protein